MEDLLETDISGHGSIENLGTGSKGKSLGHFVLVTPGSLTEQVVGKVSGLTTAGRLRDGSKGGSRRDKEGGESEGELHLDLIC
jgi:hypothetical protein